jgi:hypothetical protein
MGHSHAGGSAVPVPAPPALAAALLVVTLLAAAAPVAAQTVSGAVLEQDSGDPVPGAIVALMADGSVVHASTLTDGEGRYFLRARGPGRFTVRVQRIGFRDMATPAFELAGGAMVEQHVLVAPEAIVLEAITARSRSRCVTRPADGAAVATLWEEARKSLHVTALGRERYRFRLERYTRRLALEDLRVIQEHRSYRSGQAGSSPLVSMPAEHLLTRGFIEETDSATMYFAPDAHVLLSDGFLDAYCFRLAPERPAGDGLIGLSFEPVSRRGPPAIQGTLWLDRATFELRHLEYRYTRVVLPEGPVDRLGGRVEFEALPNGIRIVRSFWIRMPISVIRTQSIGTLRRSTVVMTGVAEEGSRVLSVTEVGPPVRPFPR